jgi:hypothetical protein
MNRHQNSGSGFEQGCERGSGFCFRVIYKPANGNFIYGAESNVDHRHYEKHNDEENRDQNFAAA